MTKEQFEKLDDDYQLLFEYYKEKGGKVKDFNEFIKIFNHLQNKMITNSVGRPVIIDHESAIERTRSHYEEKFKG